MWRTVWWEEGRSTRPSPASQGQEHGSWLDLVSLLLSLSFLLCCVDIIPLFKEGTVSPNPTAEGLAWGCELCWKQPFRGEQLKTGSPEWLNAAGWTLMDINVAFPYTAGKICSRYSRMDGQRTGEKWSDVQEAKDSGRPHKLGEAGRTCLEPSGGVWPHLGLWLLSSRTEWWASLCLTPRFCYNNPLGDYMCHPPQRWLRSEMSCTDSGLSHRPSTSRVEGASDTEEQDTVPTSSLSSNSCTAAQCPHQPDGDNAVYSPGCHRGEMNDNRAATQWLLSIVLKRQLTWRFPLTASFDLMFISQGLSQMDVGSGFLSLSPVIWVSWCRHTVSQVKRKCLTVLVSPGPSATKMSRSSWQQRWEGLIFMRHLQGTGAEDMRPGQCCSSPDGFLECWVWSGLSGTRRDNARPICSWQHQVCHACPAQASTAVLWM